MMSARSSARIPSLKRTGPSFTEAIERMKAGEVLRFAFDQGSPAWSIGDESISAEVVSLLLSCREVERTSTPYSPTPPLKCGGCVKRDA